MEGCDIFQSDTSSIIKSLDLSGPRTAKPARIVETAKTGVQVAGTSSVEIATTEGAFGDWKRGPIILAESTRDGSSRLQKELPINTRGRVTMPQSSTRLNSERYFI
jgi:hypothetical protein